VGKGGNIEHTEFPRRAQRQRARARAAAGARRGAPL